MIPGTQSHQGGSAPSVFPARMSETTGKPTRFQDAPHQFVQYRTSGGMIALSVHDDHRLETRRDRLSEEGDERFLRPGGGHAMKIEPCLRPAPGRSTP